MHAIGIRHFGGFWRLFFHHRRPVARSVPRPKHATMVSSLSSCARPVVGGLHGVSALAWGIRGAPFFECDKSRQNGCAGGKTWGIRVDMGCPRPGPAYLCRRCVELVHGSRWPRPQAPGVTPNASKHKRRRVGAQIARIPDNEHEHARHE